LTRASAVRSLRVKIRKFDPNILFLSETKTNPTVVCNILNSLGFFLMAHAPPIGTKGGLLLAWQNGVELECFITNVHTISAWCYSDPIHSPWMLSCVYGSPYHHNKDQFWDNLMDLGANFSGAWLCIGDFNMILDQSEKTEGLPYACSSRDFFRNFMNTQGVGDKSHSTRSKEESNKVQTDKKISDQKSKKISN
jgi:hypothetical protein